METNQAVSIGQNTAAPCGEIRREHTISVEQKIDVLRRDLQDMHMLEQNISVPGKDDMMIADVSNIRDQSATPAGVNQREEDEVVRPMESTISLSTSQPPEPIIGVRMDDSHVIRPTEPIIGIQMDKFDINEVDSTFDHTHDDEKKVGR